MSRLPIRRAAAAFAVVFASSVFVSAAADRRANGKSDEVQNRQPASFLTVLEQRQRDALGAVGRYIDENPQAADLEPACRWLFQTALDHGLEAEALARADDYLKREGGAAATRYLAQQVRCLGLAKSDKLQTALVAFSESLRGMRPQSANESIRFAHALAAQAQLAGDPEAARDVYERLARAFLLNPEVRELGERKNAKFDLIGETAPAVGNDDVEGKPLDWNDYRGKVVLVDFWATNCPPCLEDFPHLKQLYAEFHEQGFDIVGVSLDESAETVQQFQQSWELPWRLVLSNTGRTSLHQRYRVSTIPSVYLLDRQGRIVYVDLSGRDLRTAVQKLLAAEG